MQGLPTIRINLGVGTKGYSFVFGIGAVGKLEGKLETKVHHLQHIHPVSTPSHPLPMPPKLPSPLVFPTSPQASTKPSIQAFSSSCLVEEPPIPSWGLLVCHESLATTTITATTTATTTHRKGHWPSQACRTMTPSAPTTHMIKQ